VGCLWALLGGRRSRVSMFLGHCSVTLDQASARAPNQNAEESAPTETDSSQCIGSINLLLNFANSPSLLLLFPPPRLVNPSFPA